MKNSSCLLAMLPLFNPGLPPIGLGFLQSFLLDKGIPADILDLNNHFYNLSTSQLKTRWRISSNRKLEETILSIIKEEHPRQFNRALEQMLQYDTIGFSCFESNFHVATDIARLIRENKKNVKIIFGGPEIGRLFFKNKGNLKAEIFALADFLVVGEGERAIYNYLSGGCAKKACVFEQLPDLSSAVFPIYKGLNLNDYPKRGNLPLQFSRGCIRRCRFCSERLLYKGFRRRDTNSVIEEIRFHRGNNSAENFIFFDSMLNADLESLEELCQAIIENFGAVNWEAQIGIRSDMSVRLMKKMKESGCYNLFVGLESGSDSVLKDMNKGYSSKEAEDFFRKMKDIGMNFGISLIVGYPGESEKDFSETLDFITKNKQIIPKIEQVNPFTYYEGTPADSAADYRINPISAVRMHRLTEAIRHDGLRFTRAFLGNLTEKND